MSAVEMLEYKGKNSIELLDHILDMLHVRV